MADHVLSLNVAGIVAEPGTRTNGWISVGTRPDGSPLGIPTVLINGALPGPRIALIAGVHGDEFDCVEGMRRFLADVDPAELSGSIVATPQANPTAYEFFSRHNPVDHLDLNRNFPGNPHGFLTERVADALCRHFLTGADYCVDMHSGGMVLGLLPYVGFDASPTDVGRRSFELAQAAGIPQLYGAVAFSNVLREAAAKRGVASILVEIGSEGRLRESDVEYARMTLATTLHKMGMLPAKLCWTFNSVDEYTLLTAAKSGELMHAQTGGFLQPHVELGDIVRENQVLGRLVDPFGETIDTVLAPNSGLVAELRTIPVCRVGDWTFAVLPVVTTVRPGAPLEAVQDLL
jgi:predicted deacylase